MSVVRPPLDLRLVPAAGSAWSAALVVVRCAAGPCALAGLAAAVTAGVLLGRPGRRRRAWQATAAFALGVAAAVLLAGAAQQHVRHAGGWPQAARQGVVVTVTGRLGSAPQVVAGSSCRYLVDATVLAVRTSQARVGFPVQVVATCQDVPAGATVRVRGRLDPVAGQRAVAWLRGASLTLVRGPTGLAGLAAHARRDAARVADAIPGEAAALLPGIAWGDTSRVDDDLTARLRLSGLTHLTAVSGAHFSILTSAALALAGTLRVPRAARWAVAVAVSAALLLVVGVQPSVLRAAAMGAVAAVGLAVGRPSAGPAALSTAVVVMLIADPWLAVEVGFALSVAATGAIVLAAGPLARRWSARLPRSLAVGLAVPVVAQLACLPLLIGLRPVVPTWSVLANVAVEPAVMPVTVLGMTTVALAGWWPAAAAVTAHVAAAGCGWIVGVADMVSRLPGAGAEWLPGGVGVAAATGVAVAGLVLLVRPGLPVPALSLRPRDVLSVVHGTLARCRTLVELLPARPRTPACPGGRRCRRPWCSCTDPRGCSPNGRSTG